MISSSDAMMVRLSGLSATGLRTAEVGVKRKDSEVEFRVLFCATVIMHIGTDAQLAEPSAEQHGP